MAEINISIEGGGVIAGSPYVIHNTYVTLERGGKVVGTIKARFDFSDCPPEFHSLAFQMLPEGRRIPMARPLSREELRMHDSLRQLERLRVKGARPWWKFW